LAELRGTTVRKKVEIADYPEGITSFSQCCHDEGGATLGNKSEIASTLNGLNQFALTHDATLSGLQILWTIDPG
jgi:hypothetical protein